MCVPLPEVCPPPPLLPFGLGQALGPRAAVQASQQLWEGGHTMRRSPESCLYVGLDKKKEASCSCLCRVSAPCIGPDKGSACLSGGVWTQLVLIAPTLTSPVGTLALQCLVSLGHHPSPLSAPPFCGFFQRKRNLKLINPSYVPDPLWPFDILLLFSSSLYCGKIYITKITILAILKCTFHWY